MKCKHCENKVIYEIQTTCMECKQGDKTSDNNLCSSCALKDTTCQVCEGQLYTSNYYYTSTVDNIFKEVQSAAITIWRTYDDKHDYAYKKIRRVNDLVNKRGNLMHIVSMFDYYNQCKLARLLSVDTRKVIYNKLKAGGQPEAYNPFKVL